MTQRTKFTVSWRRSTQVRKQRKYVHRAPLHLKQKMMHTHVAKPLREKYGVRAIQLRKGDTVKVVRGEFRGKEGKVERITLKTGRVYVASMDRVKADGSKVPVIFHPSNLMIVEFDLSDKRRKAKLTSKNTLKTPDKNKEETHKNKAAVKNTV
ncbi:50S ribosomal protein L24 [Candidatus Woesearchaeota archaeon]|nr:50S ribosomal protein L24 [Candidatus Woesearchaeota archaeon]